MRINLMKIFPVVAAMVLTVSCNRQAFKRASEHHYPAIKTGLKIGDKNILVRGPDEFWNAELKQAAELIVEAHDLERANDLGNISRAKYHVKYYLQDNMQIIAMSDHGHELQKKFSDLTTAKIDVQYWDSNARELRIQKNIFLTYENGDLILETLGIVDPNYIPDYPTVVCDPTLFEGKYNNIYDKEHPGLEKRCPYNMMGTSIELDK